MAQNDNSLYPSRYSYRLNEEKLRELMKLADFGNSEEKIIKLFYDKISKNMRYIIDEYYSRLLVFDYPRTFFKDEKYLSKIKEKQGDYFKQFFTGSHDIHFLESRKSLGAIHERVGLDNFWYLASYAVFFEQFAELACRETNGTEIIKVLGKLMFIDIGAVATSYLEAREEIITSQASELKKKRLFETVGKLAGGITHDFNNYLSVMAGITELLNSDEDLSQKNVGLLTTLASTIEKASSLINQLQMFSKSQIVQYFHFNINNLITKLNFEHDLRFSKIEIDFDLDSELSGKYIMGNTSQMHQVLSNLIVNAAESISSDTGKIIVRTKYMLGKQKDCVIISVIDNGIGIEKEFLDKIFDPYFSSKKTNNFISPNFGLGLSIVYTIINQMDGEIKVTSNAGSGTRFDIRLLLSHNFTSDPKIDQIIDRPNRTGKLSTKIKDPGTKILVVEDNKDLLEIISNFLKKSNFTIISCLNGAEALGRYIIEKDVDLIITDMMLPDINGNDLIKNIRDNLGATDVKVLFMSGYADDIIDINIIDKQTMFVSKPFPLETFKDKIFELLEINQ